MSEPSKYDIGDRLIALRKKAGLTQPELEKAIGVGVNTESMYERGINYPSILTLIKLAEFYGVTTDYILGREEKQ